MPRAPIRALHTEGTSPLDRVATSQFAIGRSWVEVPASSQARLGGHGRDRIRFVTRAASRALVGGMNAGGTSEPRLDSLDGLRGLAVAAGLLYHSKFGFARGGYLGVSLFFTLSGFLITSLLLTQLHERRRVRLGAFWSRRVRRLLPAATLALGAVLLYGATLASGDQLRELRVDVLSALGYVA